MRRGWSTGQWNCIDRPRDFFRPWTQCGRCGPNSSNSGLVKRSMWSPTSLRPLPRSISVNSVSRCRCHWSPLPSNGTVLPSAVYCSTSRRLSRHRSSRKESPPGGVMVSNWSVSFAITSCKSDRPAGDNQALLECAPGFAQASGRLPFRSMPVRWEVSGCRPRPSGRVVR